MAHDCFEGFARPGWPATFRATGHNLQLWVTSALLLSWEPAAPITPVAQRVPTAVFSCTHHCLESIALQFIEHFCSIFCHRALEFRYMDLSGIDSTDDLICIDMIVITTRVNRSTFNLSSGRVPHSVWGGLWSNQPYSSPTVTLGTS